MHHLYLSWLRLYSQSDTRVFCEKKLLLYIILYCIVFIVLHCIVMHYLILSYLILSYIILCYSWS